MGGLTNVAPPQFRILFGPSGMWSLDLHFGTGSMGNRNGPAIVDADEGSLNGRTAYIIPNKIFIVFQALSGYLLNANLDAGLVKRLFHEIWNSWHSIWFSPTILNKEKD